MQLSDLLEVFSEAIADRVSAKIQVQKVDQQTQEEEYLTFKEAKTMCRWKHDLPLRQRVKAGLIPAVKIGGKWMFKKSDIQNFLSHGSK